MFSPGIKPGESINWGDTRPKNQNSVRCCKSNMSRVFVVKPVAAGRFSRADRTECKSPPPPGRAPAQLTWTARRRGSWNRRPCNHNRVRDRNRAWENRQPTCLHSHHEEDATRVSCAGAIGRVCVGAQTQGAQDQTQEVTQHHQEDHTGQDQKYYPPGQAHTHTHAQTIESVWGFCTDHTHHVCTCTCFTWCARQTPPLGRHSELCCAPGPHWSKGHLAQKTGRL